MARPRTPIEQRPVQRTVRLSPYAFDTAYRYAQKRGISINALMQRTLEYVFTHQKTIERSGSCYVPSQTSSTLSGLLGESPSIRASSDSKPSLLLGRR